MLAVNHNLDGRGVVAPAPAQVSGNDKHVTKTVIVAAACASIILLSAFNSFMAIFGIVAVYYIAQQAMEGLRPTRNGHDQGVGRSAPAQPSERNAKLVAVAVMSMGAFACVAVLGGGGLPALVGIVAMYYLTEEALRTRGSQR